MGKGDVEAGNYVRGIKKEEWCNKKKELKRRKRESSHVLKRGQISTSAAFNVFWGLLHSCGALRVCARSYSRD